MAIRNIRKIGDDILRKKCRKVEQIDYRIKTLLDDLADTMYEADGVGLAAPQVGILKRVAVVDVGEGIVELINPVITETSGTQTDTEGCLSVPDRYGKVERPQTVTVKTLDRDGNEYEITGQGLFARALCHEIEHLDGIMFVDKVSEYVEVNN
ncbi:MAG: peptide deformylase [Clostridia bacterium]|nr:peptide deformylase [Clostridia bacterium]